MNHKKVLYTLLTLLLIAVTACNANSNPTATQAAGEATYRPLDAAGCQALQGNIAQALNTQFTISESDLADFGVQGKACHMEAKGTGANFDLVNSLNAIEQTLAGWTPDVKLAAGGPTGIVQGYTKGNQLVMVSIQWEPAPDANCPTDQPISACSLAPEQKLYTVGLSAAQK